MENFNIFEIEKSELMKKLGYLSEMITELKQYGFNNLDDSIEKIEKIIGKIEKNKISIAMVGGFSDGKTSVVAGWLNKKKEDMKIDADESTDEIVFYSAKELEDNCEIVDTPGLYGNKEKQNEKGGIEKLSDKTKKYLSEANIILYVVDAQNPIKDSHRDSLEWILKDLNKASHTIFVINKMDEVVDLADDESFCIMAETKRENVRNKLVNWIGLDSGVVNNIEIICISSNPGDRGFDFWQQHREVYESRSHIGELRNTTVNLMKKNTKSDLVKKAGVDGLNELININKQNVEGLILSLEEEIIPSMEQCKERNTQTLNNLKKDINNVKRNLVDELARYEKSLQISLNAVTPDTVANFLSEEIGIVYSDETKTGYLFYMNINKIMSKNFEEIDSHIEFAQNQFVYEYNNQKDMFETINEKYRTDIAVLLKSLPGPEFTKAMKAFLTTCQEMLAKVGVNFAKGWFGGGVSKMAKAINKSIPYVAAAVEVGMDIYELYKSRERQKEFAAFKTSMNDFISTTFADMYTSINDKDFEANYVPQIGALEKQLKNEEENIIKAKNKHSDLVKWKEKLIEVFDAEIVS